jgi:hypothetical protein
LEATNQAVHNAKEDPEDGIVGGSPQNSDQVAQELDQGNQ